MPIPVSSIVKFTSFCFVILIIKVILPLYLVNFNELLMRFTRICIILFSSDIILYFSKTSD